MAKTTIKRPRGRPSRNDASRAALDGIDLALVDPMAVLRAIAADVTAPASARVAAAKALLKDQSMPDQKPAEPEESTERDPVARRALRILNGGKR